MSRVCRVLPPRRHSAAFSSSKTLAPDSRAEIAATSPALPPPTTMTSLAIVTCHPELARDLGLLGLTAYCRHVSSRACEGSRLARIVRLLDQRQLHLEHIAFDAPHIALVQSRDPTRNVQSKARARLARLSCASPAEEPLEQMLRFVTVRARPTARHAKPNARPVSRRRHVHRPRLIAIDQRVAQ